MDENTSALRAWEYWANSRAEKWQSPEVAFVKKEEFLMIAQLLKAANERINDQRERIEELENIVDTLRQAPPLEF